MKATPEAGVALLPTDSSVKRIKYQAFACRLTDWIDYLILWNRISIMLHSRERPGRTDIIQDHGRSLPQAMLGFGANLIR